MAKSYPIDTSTPLGTATPTEGDDQIRGVKSSIVEFLSKDHYVGASSPYNEDAGGEHAKITLRQASKPTNAADKGFVYTKDVSGATELFYLDEAGNEKQLTTAGKLNVLDADGAVVKTGNQTIEGVKNFGSIPTVESDTHPPTTDYQLADKKYVDDQITASVTKTSLTGALSFATSNGNLKIIAGNKEGTGTTDSVDFTDIGGADFNSLVAILISVKTDGTLITYVITDSDNAGFSVKFSQQPTRWYWTAIGY